MRIETSSAIDNGLLLAGFPFRMGEYSPEQSFRLVTGDGNDLPLWWIPRAEWPDGSLRWIWLHGRVPAGKHMLELLPTDEPPELPKWLWRQDGMRVACRRLDEDTGIRLVFTSNRWWLSGDGMRVEGTDQPDELDPPIALGQQVVQPTVVEHSPIAPLFRLQPNTGEEWLRESLFRVDLTLGVLYWTRRVTLLSGPRYDLRRMAATVELSEGEWGLPGTDAETLRVLRPHHVQYGDGPEQDGHPDPLLISEGAAAWLDKGWQRAPFGLCADGSLATVEFYPGEAEPLPVLQGTSFRHDLRVAVGPDAEAHVRNEVRWQWDSEMVAQTGALGPLVPRNEQVQRLFPGFDRAFQQGIEECRPTKLDKPDGSPAGPAGDLADEACHDEEFFGLEHYGDWPMPLGSYGGTARMYCDNEYDVAYALFQQFARTGQWEILDLAKHSAVHMTDVDFLAHSGDMRYHGYHAQAEDHRATRVGGGELGHVWADGYWCLHLILGDPFAREAAIALTRKLRTDFTGEDDDTIRRHFTGCERAVGWPMVAMCATMELEPDPETLAVLEHMSRYVAQYMRDPDAEFEGIATIGGRPVQWWRCAALDGSKPFMLGVLMEGLERYHRLSGSTAARDALVAIATFLRDVMWVPTASAFIYELNAYNRAHRDRYPHYINLLVTRGLAYAYELTGDESFRQLTTDAAYGGLWTVFETTGGKEIGMVGRTSGATMAYMLDWWQRDQDALAAAQPASTGVVYEFAGTPQTWLERPELALAKGQPEFDETGALICRQNSFAICHIDHGWTTESGRVQLKYAPERTINWDGGGNAGPGWALLHLCDERFTASAVTVMHFYDGLHVRFYDRHRKLIEVLETSVQGWQAGEERTIEFAWNTREATLWLDGQEAHRVPMQRRLSGEFRRLYLGCKPGNWKGKGTLFDMQISLRT